MVRVRRSRLDFVSRAVRSCASRRTPALAIGLLAAASCATVLSAEPADAASGVGAAPESAAAPAPRPHLALVLSGGGARGAAPVGVLKVLEEMHGRLEIRATGETDFDRLPIPYRAVAADLANGKAVILDRGSLATAMRASMSIAGMFPPVQLDGRKLIDGGAAANLPIGIAQELGATKVIAVDITSPLDNSAELGSMFQILGQWTGYITEGNRIEDLKRLRPGDVLIQPALGDISFMAFTRAEEAIGLGEAAAREAVGDLKRFAVSDAAWAEFKARHHPRLVEETRVDEVKVVNSSWVDDRVVTRHLDIPTGAPFDDEKVRTEI